MCISFGYDSMDAMDIILLTYGWLDVHSFCLVSNVGVCSCRCKKSRIKVFDPQGSKTCYIWIICFVHRTYLYNLVDKGNWVHNLFSVRLFFSVHVSVNYMPIIRRNTFIYATLGVCHSVWMTVWYAPGILYMFQATMWPSSGETTLCMRHLMYVIVWITVCYVGAYAPTYQSSTQWHGVFHCVDGCLVCTPHSLSVSGNYMPIIRRNIFIYATLGVCHSVWMTVM